MALANDGDVIKTFRSHRADAHGPDAPDEGSAIGAVAVADQVAWRLVPAAGLGRLTASHSALGWAVTPSHRSSRRDCRKMRSPYRSPNEIVGTTNMSIDAMASA
jgi:hypothetical protein